MEQSNESARELSDNEKIRQLEVPPPGAAARIQKKVDEKMKIFNMEKRRRVAKTFIHMQNVIITH